MNSISFNYFFQTRINTDLHGFDLMRGCGSIFHPCNTRFKNIQIKFQPNLYQSAHNPVMDPVKRVEQHVRTPAHPSVFDDLLKGYPPVKLFEKFFFADLSSGEGLTPFHPY